MAVLTSEQVAALPRRVVKPSDQVVTNSDVLQDDDDLHFDVEANVTYFFTMTLIALQETGASNDFLLGWTVPAGTTMLWKSFPRGEAEPAHTESDTDMNLYGDPATIEQYRGYVFVGGTPGTVQLQWAQNGAEDFDHTIKAGSFIDYGVVS